MTPGPYSHPPITEAVIELRLVEAVDPRLVEKVSDALAVHYPRLQILDNHELEIRPTGFPIASRSVGHIYRRASDAQTEIMVVSVNNFAVAQLPDYPSWEVFIERFRRDWEAWRHIMNVQRLGRIGVRYINRIDIPTDSHLIQEKDYLNTFINMPDLFGNEYRYALQVSFPCPAIGGMVLVNSGVVPSPLEGHVSILLDIDISKDHSLPMRESEFFNLLNEFRNEKNRVFEACLTQKQKDTFK